MNTILHITQREEWEAAQKVGSYRAASLDREGFIHCSRSTQIIKVANRFFYQQQGLVLLFIDADQVKAEVRDEEAEVGELFPHVYGELNVDAVYQVVDFGVGEDGFFVLPSEVVELE